MFAYLQEYLQVLRMNLEKDGQRDAVRLQNILMIINFCLHQK